MPKAQEARSSAIAWDGAETRTVSLGLVAHAASAANGDYFIVPFDCYIAEAGFVVGVQATHASATVALGTLADPDAIVEDFTLTNVAAGTKYVFQDDASFVSAAARNLSKGDIININTAAASAVGSVGAWLVLTPRQ